MTDPSVLQEIVRRIVQVALPERIILFGSAARGEGGPDSDIDLLIVKSNVHRRRLAMDLYEALADIEQAVDLIVATPEDIERYGQSPALVLESALREGKLLYAA
jgi:predicted nucleotidyltransferase